MRLPTHAVCACLLAGIGCGDPSVHISFEVPAPYRDQVESVTLRILVPPPAGPFDCDEVAFGEVPDQEIALSAVQEVVARGDDRISLSGIPRREQKVLLIEGFDSQELSIVAACAEVGEIKDDTDIELIGEPTAVVAIPNVDPGQIISGRVPILVADGNGDALVGVETRWAVTGPAGVTFEGTELTNASGLAELSPELPSLPGPMALDVRARWQRTQPESVLGFRDPPVLFTGDLPGESSLTLVQTEQLFQVGRIGPSGEMGFAALGPAASAQEGRQIFIAYYDASLTPPFASAETALISGAVALGMVTRDGRDRVFVITPTQWIEIEPNGAQSPRASPALGRFATRIAPVSSCEPGAAIDAVLVQLSDNSFATYDENGLPIQGPFDDEPSSSRIAGSGCVAGLGTDTHRAVAFSGGVAGGQTIVAQMDTVRRGSLDVLRSGIGFAPTVGADGASLLGTEIDVTGTSISRFRLVPLSTDGVDLDLVTQDATATLPLSTAGGDLDGDGTADIASVLSFGESTGLTQFRVFVALGVDHDGTRLVGLSPQNEAERPRLWIADFDQDGVDDVLIGSPDSFSVLRMGAP